MKMSAKWRPFGTASVLKYVIYDIYNRGASVLKLELELKIESGQSSKFISVCVHKEINRYEDDELEKYAKINELPSFLWCASKTNTCIHQINFQPNTLTLRKPVNNWYFCYRFITCKTRLPLIRYGIAKTQPLMIFKVTGVCNYVLTQSDTKLRLSA